MTFTNALFVSFSHPHTPQALRTVLELMRRDQGTVRVLAVIPPTPALQRLLTPRETTDHVDTILREELLSDLHDWVDKAAGEREPADVTIEVATGHAVAAVLDRIVEHDHDLLALTGHPDDPVARAVIKRLQRKSPCPVWAIRPSRARKRRILAAVDTTDDHHALNHRVLAAAGWLAGPGDELHIATAWELLGESTMRSSPFVGTGDQTVDELRARCEADHCTTLEKLVAAEDLGQVDVHLHVRNGQPAEVIVDLVDRFNINQLVMGTIGRTGIPGFVIGNTAEQLLSEVPCSEFVVKPPGFSSAYHA